MQHAQTPQERLRHHVTGAIQRGDAQAITAQDAPTSTPQTPELLDVERARSAGIVPNVCNLMRDYDRLSADEFRAAVEAGAAMFRRTGAAVAITYTPDNDYVSGATLEVYTLSASTYWNSLQLDALRERVKTDSDGNRVATCAGCGNAYAMSADYSDQQAASALFNADWRYILMEDAEAVYCRRCVADYAAGRPLLRERMEATDAQRAAEQDEAEQREQDEADNYERRNAEEAERHHSEAEASACS